MSESVSEEKVDLYRCHETKNSELALKAKNNNKTAKLHFYIDKNNELTLRAKFNNKIAKLHFYIDKNNELTLKAKFNNKIAQYQNSEFTFLHRGKKQRNDLKGNCQYSTYMVYSSFFSMCQLIFSVLLSFAVFLSLIGRLCIPLLIRH